MQVVVELPEASLAALRMSPEAFARDMVLAAVAKWYEMGKVSQSKGAAICGVSRGEFLKVLSDHKVSILQLDEPGLDRELA